MASTALFGGLLPKYFVLDVRLVNHASWRANLIVNVDVKSVL